MDYFTPVGVPQGGIYSAKRRNAKPKRHPRQKRSVRRSKPSSSGWLLSRQKRNGEQTEAAVRERYSNVVDQGLAARDSRDDDNAIVKFSEAIQLDPRNPSAFHSRGVAYWNKGDYDRAIVDYNEAIEIDPKMLTSFTTVASLI